MRGKLSRTRDTNYPKLVEVVVAEFRSESVKMFWKDDMMANEIQKWKLSSKKVCESDE